MVGIVHVMSDELLPGPGLRLHIAPPDFVRLVFQPPEAKECESATITPCAPASKHMKSIMVSLAGSSRAPGGIYRAALILIAPWCGLKFHFLKAANMSETCQTAGSRARPDAWGAEGSTFPRFRFWFRA